jgi:hypothetical protein
VHPPPPPPPHTHTHTRARAGGELISEDLGHKLEKVELQQLGQVKKVTVTKDDTILLHGGGEGCWRRSGAGWAGVGWGALVSCCMQQWRARVAGGWAGVCAVYSSRRVRTNARTLMAASMLALDLAAR